MSEIIKCLERARGGEPQAWEALLEMIQDQVYYHCRKILKREEDAEDAAQEVLISVLSGLDSLREPSAFWGWVNGIIVNQCRRFFRKTPEWQIPEDEEGGSLLDDLEDLDEQTVPDKALDNEETRRMILGLVDALPPEQRICVLYYYYDELSVKQIAALTEASEGTVKSRLNYARKSIKEGVKDYEKQGIKLYGLSPLPFLLYFLRRDAESSAMAPEAAKAMVRRALASQGEAAASGGAAAAASKAGSAAGTAAAHTAGGISTKAVACILAGAVAVGGVGMLLPRNRDSAPSQPDPPAITQPAQPKTPMVDSALAQLLSYTGDRFAMSVDQAAGFALALDEEIAKSQAYRNPFCLAALFDAGDGVPAMFVASGNDLGYDMDPESGRIPERSMVYYWDGTETGKKATLGASNVILTDQGILVDDFSPFWEEEPYSFSMLYSLSGGCVSEDPVHVYEHFCLFQDWEPTEEHMQSAADMWGLWRDFENLPERGQQVLYDRSRGRWEFYETGMGPCWAIAALDGRFLPVSEAMESGQALMDGVVTWKLGQGQRGHTDAAWFWTDGWMDAGEMAQLLRSAGGAG